MRVAAEVARNKEQHPERYCPEPRCLWRTGDGSRCPRHRAEPVDDVPSKLPSDRLREWSVTVTERYTGVTRELRVDARGQAEAGFLAHHSMTEFETIDSITD